MKDREKSRGLRAGRAASVAVIAAAFKRRGGIRRARFKTLYIGRVRA
jgi:hypothetical protein